MQLLKIIHNTFKSGELSNEDYHAFKGISGTGLSKIYSSSMLAWKKTERKQSDALGFGIASHANFLEPELFNKEFYRGFDETEHPEALRGQKQFKEFLGKNGLKLSGSKSEQIERIVEFIKQTGDEVKIIDLMKSKYDEANKGKIEISADNFSQLQGMRDRLLSDPVIVNLIKGAMIEKSIICKVDFYDELSSGEKNTGQFICIVKIRPDIVSRRFALVDYKTCLDCYDKFIKDTYNLNYDLKMALQHDILRLVYARSPQVTLLAQNKLAPSELTNPFEYKPWLLNDEVISNGRTKYLIAIRRYCEYQQSKELIGQGNDPEYVPFLNWASASA